MNYRHKRRPTPGFGIGSPFNPTTGEYAKLQGEGVNPYCAMVQVAAEDDKEDYVICRGFDPRIRKFIDYEEGNDDKPGISVAKPYGRRSTGAYSVGQVFPAFLPTQGTLDYTPPSPTAVLWRVGQNPGFVVEAPEGGHPEDLDDEISTLTDDNDKEVNWLLIGGTQDAAVVHGKAQHNWESNTSDPRVSVKTCDRDGDNETGEAYYVYLPKTGAGDVNVLEDDVIAYRVNGSGVKICVSSYMDGKFGDLKWTTIEPVANDGWVVHSASTGRFLKSIDDVGDIGPSVAGNTGRSETGITKTDDDGDHNHRAGGTSFWNQWSSDNVGASFTWHAYTAFAAYTGGENAASLSGANSHEHSLTEPTVGEETGHIHTGADPVTYSALLLIRVNNQYNP